MTESGIKMYHENMIVRPVDDGDADEFFELIDMNRAYLRDWLTWLDFMKSVETTRKYIESRKKLMTEKAGFCFVVTESEKIVGIVHLVDVDHQNKKAMIGYWIAESHAGRGLTTKATKTVVSFAFMELKLHRLEIKCATNNVGSRAIAEKLGFKYEGTLRDGEWLHDRFVNQELYSRLSSDK